MQRNYKELWFCTSIEVFTWENHDMISWPSFLVFLCVSGGFAGDGHLVGSGQQTAGEVQDAGGNRWAASHYFTQNVYLNII